MHFFPQSYQFILIVIQFLVDCVRFLDSYSYARCTHFSSPTTCKEGILVTSKRSNHPWVGFIFRIVVVVVFIIEINMLLGSYVFPIFSAFPILNIHTKNSFTFIRTKPEGYEQIVYHSTRQWKKRIFTTKREIANRARTKLTRDVGNMRVINANMGVITRIQGK